MLTYIHPCHFKIKYKKQPKPNEKLIVTLKNFWQNEIKFSDVVFFRTSFPQQDGMKDKHRVFQVPILMFEKGSLSNFTVNIKQI